MSEILVVAQDTEQRESLAAALGAAGLSVAATADLEQARAALAAGVEVAVLDPTALAEGEAGDVLDLFARNDPPVPCIVTVRHARLEDAVDLMRRGAFSVVTLPADPEQIQLQARQALRHRELAVRNAELVRSLELHERLAMIGKLAAGVAHELNNPLDGVLRFVNLSVDSLPKDSSVLPFLIEARRGLRRMADIVRDLLQFSRNATVEAADEDAERLARDAVLQVASAARSRIDARFEFPEGGLQLPRGMFQVLGNLAKNAVDAMPQGGVLRVSASVADGRVHVRVSDTGTGIPEEIRDRVFEPFFTTKEVGSGTGLGLPICQRIVERLGGTLVLESEVGRGTVVVIELPARRHGAARPRGRRALPIPVVPALSRSEEA